MERAELEKLSSVELHDRAVARAKRRLDVAFFWRLIRALPAAEAAAGHVGDAESDVMSLSAHVNDLVKAGEPDVADVLRPFYLDYLEKHGG